MSILAYILPSVSASHISSSLASFSSGHAPFSTWPTVVAAILTYLVVIFGIQDNMRSRKPIRLNVLFQVHNVVLSAGSLLLLGLIAEEIGPILYQHGFFYGMCSSKALTPKLQLYYIINYYMKYVELLDTVFLALKKKPLTFLHVFHHSATAILCYSQVTGKPAYAWLLISLNLAVHVVMYYYYYATASGRRIWWKKYLTSMQIIQFLIDQVAVYFALMYNILPRHPGYVSFAARYAPMLPHTITCSGTEGTAWFGCALIVTYLFLFMSFYQKTYRKRENSKEMTAASTNGHVKELGSQNKRGML